MLIFEFDRRAECSKTREGTDRVPLDRLYPSIMVVVRKDRKEWITHLIKIILISVSEHQHSSRISHLLARSDIILLGIVIYNHPVWLVTTG